MTSDGQTPPEPPMADNDGIPMGLTGSPLSPMLKLTLRHMREKWIRFTLTMMTVVLGVMFMVGSFVLTDSLRHVFSGLADDIAGGSDLVVRRAREINNDFDLPTLPESLAETVRSVEGVDEALPAVVSFNVVIVDAEGEPILPMGPPTLGFSFAPHQFFMAEGRAPGERGEFAADATTAADNDLRVGESYDINGPLFIDEFELVGIFNFGSPEANNSLGQTMAAFELETAQEFLGFDDEYVEIEVIVEPGSDRDAVRAALEAALEEAAPGESYQVITQEMNAEEERADFNQFIGIFNTVLLVFALITVFVSAFIINNTFQIVLGQRIRELGLWRSLGATPKQVTGSVLIESALLGLLSTVIGIGLGVLASLVMRVLLKAGGFGLPDGPLVLRPRTVLLAMLVGLGVTVGSAITPAVRAQRISPVSALSLTHSFVSEAGMRRRIVVGGVVTAAGVASLAFGLFFEAGGTTTVLSLIGAGALTMFLGINVLSPAFARPVAGVLGSPVLAALGVPGRLARDNATRNPRRTASTGGALMIGLALVGLTTVVGASLEKTLVTILADAVEADYFVRTSRNFDPTSGFPEQVAVELEELPEIESVVGYRYGLGSVQVDGSPRDILATELAYVEDHLDGAVRSGDLSSADPLTSLALHTDPAEDLGVGVGDTLEVTFPDSAAKTLTVAAVYEDAAIYGNWMIDMQLWEEHFTRRDLAFVSAAAAGLSDELDQDQQAEILEGVQTTIEEALEAYPTVRVENRAEFRESQQNQLNSILIVITVLLGLSLVIALAGITNTLALSVFERTNEIGLLRAVGMTRRQLRKSIRWEAAVVAVYGALLGVVVGTASGVAVVRAIPDSAIKYVALPVGQLIVYVAIAGVAGLLAATGPAMRAGRMNILEAIAQE